MISTPADLPVGERPASAELLPQTRLGRARGNLHRGRVLSTRNCAATSRRRATVRPRALPGPGLGVEITCRVYRLRKPRESPLLAGRGATATNDSVLLSDPGFHAQDAYAIVMRTLARFESSLGRRVSWGFYGRQLQVAPHGIEDANAF